MFARAHTGNVGSLPEMTDLSVERDLI